MSNLPGTALPEGQVTYAWRRVRPVDETDPNYIPAVPPVPADEKETDGSSN